MAAPSLTKAERELMAELGMEFSEPPEVAITRRSKHAARYELVKTVARKNPDRKIKLFEWAQASQPYALAKAINNNDRKEFAVPEDAEGKFTAFAGPIPAWTDEDEVEHPQVYAIWITYTEK